MTTNQTVGCILLSFCLCGSKKAHIPAEYLHCFDQNDTCVFSSHTSLILAWPLRGGEMLIIWKDIVQEIFLKFISFSDKRVFLPDLYFFSLLLIVRSWTLAFDMFREACNVRNIDLFFSEHYKVWHSAKFYWGICPLEDSQLSFQWFPLVKNCHC